MSLHRPRRIYSALVLLAALLTNGCSASEAGRAAGEGGARYDRGDYDGALPLLEKAAAQGAEDGEGFYQLAFIYDLKGMADKARQAREKAGPLLEKRIASSRAPLEIYYYLTALYFNLQKDEEMKGAAQRGIEKFGAARNLSGSDLFRLGRLYQFQGRGDLSAASYHRAVEAFEKEQDPNPILYSLALDADGRTDLQSHRFADAGRKLDLSFRLNPKAPDSLFRRGLAHLGAADLDGAAALFSQVRDEEHLTEAQYALDLVKHLKLLEGPTTVDSANRPLMEMDDASLEEALRSAADAVRRSREEAATHQGTSKSVQDKERIFFSLTWEWMIRGKPIRETALSSGYADLIRR